MRPPRPAAWLLALDAVHLRLAYFAASAVACAAVSCGGAGTPAAAPSASSAAEPSPDPSHGEAPARPSEPGESGVSASAHGRSTPTADPAPSAFPTTCAAGSAGDVCTPPGDFVERVCQKPHQDAALVLFGASTPFTRLYLRGRLDELNGGEEVLVLRFHAPQKGGMVVGANTGTYDVLRWDGTCSKGVESEAFTRTHPSHPGAARIQWHRISTRVQDALVAGSPAVKQAHAKRGKECRGAMTGDVSAACVKADAALGTAVVEVVRSGARLPEPEDSP